MASLYDLFFGCSHSNTGFPITVKAGQRRTAGSLTGTYVVCLDCGREFAYDWKEMRIVGDAVPVPAGAATPVESYAGK